MEQKNKVFLALLIALVMVVAILSSFGLNFFSGDQPEIVLPSPVITDSGEQSADDPTAGGGFLPVDVTPETVQSVIATLERPENYYRAITIEVATGGDTTGSFYAQVWVDGAWTRVEMAQPLRAMGLQYTIIYLDKDTGKGMLYRWYGGNNSVKSWAVDERGGDLAQHIPTYEEVLELEPERIVEAGFGERDGMSCIYVETDIDELGYLERYWISTDNGLLVGAETEKEGQIVLSMTSTEADVLQQEGNFTLPDGTVLYEPDSG